jgi:sugar phosphate isomerase/epimerase
VNFMNFDQSCSRRGFLRGATAMAGSALFLGSARSLGAYPLDGVLGVQSNDVGKLMQADLTGTLKQLASFGYRALDLVVNPAMAAEHRQALDAAGMICHNGHFNAATFEDASWAQTLQVARTLGVKSMVYSGGIARDAKVDDWKKYADTLNATGAKTKKDGLQLGWHNHGEFRPVEGQVPYDILLDNTDPALVKFQIDVGNAANAGADPYMYLSKYPTRFFSMHVRDVAPGGPPLGQPQTAPPQGPPQPGQPPRPGTEAVAIGQGILDWQRMFKLAKAANIHDYDVETSPSDTVMERLRASADFLKRFPRV